MPLTLFLVALGGFLGAPARAVLDRALWGRSADFPLGTFVVNCTGSFVLGMLAGLGLSERLPGPASELAGTGFCGAFTTFSTFSFESLRLLERGEYLMAVLNVGGSVVFGLGAAGLGLVLGLS